MFSSVRKCHGDTLTAPPGPVGQAMSCDLYHCIARPTLCHTCPVPCAYRPVQVLKKGLAAVLVSDDKRREDRERKLAYNARAQAEIKELKQHSIPKTLRDMDKSAIRRAKLRDEGANTGSRSAPFRPPKTRCM